MKIAVFSAKPYDSEFLKRINKEKSLGHELQFFEEKLNARTCPMVTEGFEAVCVFVNDAVDAKVVEHLASVGVKLVALRCAGFNNVDLEATRERGLTVARVPAYSPDAVAEHAVALMLTLNRKMHKAFNKVREGNFALDGLLGFDMKGKTVGVVGTGKIGLNVARILAKGFQCNVIAYDVYPNKECQELGVPYVALDELLQRSDIVSVHVPLLPSTRHMINAESLAKMKTGVMLINTSRGALVDTRAVIDALKSGKLGYLGLDVYEEEESLFFEDHSSQVLQDDVFSRLLTFPNVLLTGHQAFFTDRALEQIATTTLENCSAFASADGVKKDNLVLPTAGGSGGGGGSSATAAATASTAKS